MKIFQIRKKIKSPVLLRSARGAGAIFFLCDTKTGIRQIRSPVFSPAFVNFCAKSEEKVKQPEQAQPVATHIAPRFILIM